MSTFQRLLISVLLFSGAIASGFLFWGRQPGWDAFFWTAPESQVLVGVVVPVVFVTASIAIWRHWRPEDYN